MEMRQILLSWFWMIVFVLSASSMVGQDAPFRAEVNKDSIRGDEICQVRFIIKDMEGEFEPPDFGDFEPLGPPHRSSYFRSVNGNSSRLNTYTFYLRPVKTGLLLIPPAQFKSDKATWNTQAIDIWVQPGTLPEHPPDEGKPDRETKRI